MRPCARPSQSGGARPADTTVRLLILCNNTAALTRMEEEAWEVGNLEAGPDKVVVTLELDNVG